MTQKHTEHTQEQHHQPAPKHEERREMRHEASKRQDTTAEHRRHDTKHDTKVESKRHETHEQHPEHHGKGSASTIKVANWEIKADNLTAQDRKYIEQYGNKLSPTTLRAKWINKVDEKEDHPGQTLATRNPEVIQHWAEERGGTPATVPGTEHGSHLGVLRINFPGYGGENLQAVSWQQWFDTFKDRKLVFLFQQQMRNGHQSNFFHLDSPVREHD